MHTRPWWVKTLRVFVFTFLGTFILAITPLADQIASGETLSLGPSLLLGLVAGAVAAGLRAVAAYLPVFADDQEGLGPGPI